MGLFASPKRTLLRPIRFRVCYNSHDVLCCRQADRLHRYTSLGSTFNTLPNPALRRAKAGHPADQEEAVSYLPAYELQDETLERAGRYKISSSLEVTRLTPPTLIELSKPAATATQA